MERDGVTMKWNDNGGMSDIVSMRRQTQAQGAQVPKMHPIYPSSSHYTASEVYPSSFLNIRSPSLVTGQFKSCMSS
jgi:hypothetical protein